ncbi:MAG: selenocysteine-specific translation elongation factor, partial [Acidobacteria bacterium]|nr:selenocysteine-specific translation elongation factor [Acidobacteriota bacterium]
SEEKRRGITIALGFAPMIDPTGEAELSFIDVPGHERLVHTMIAGAGGIDRALLVVAADEGVMPQTREHLDVLRLLGVTGGVVALTKADLVSDEDLLALRILEVREALADGCLAEAPIIPCSAATGVGIVELRDAILASGRSVVHTIDPHRPFRLSADRVFSLAGAGTIVTGTARSGEVAVGNELLALPSRRTVRVRGLQVHGAARTQTSAGERVAVSLAGVEVAEVPRGEQLLGAGPWQATARLALDVELLGDGRALAEGDRIWLHLLAARVVARVERLYPAPLAPGSRGRVIVRLAKPVYAAPGDRAILRAISPAQTLGGARVLDSDPPRLRRRDVAALARLPDPVRDPDAALAGMVAAASAAGISPRRLGARLGVRESGIEASLGRLLAAARIVAVPGREPLLIDAEVVAELRTRAAKVLAQAPGIGLPIAEFMSRLVGENSPSVRAFILDDLRRVGLVRETAGRVLSASDSPLANDLAVSLEEIYRAGGFEAPSPEEAAVRIGANPKTVAGVVRFLVDSGRLARVGGKWVLHRELLDGIATSVRGWEVESFDVGQFKERVHLTRKLAIPILEWLDSQRVTRREGERRRILRPRAGTSSPG